MNNKKRFLEKISEKLFLEYGDDLSNIVIVFPSRRAHVFFLEELRQFIKKPIWLPNFFSIEDIVFKIGGFTQINKLELFFTFYQLYSATIKNPQPLDQCYKWATILLEDFNEIDKSCVDYLKLFSSLSDVKRLDSWGLDVDEANEYINDYLLFFDELKILYTKLKSELLSNKSVYSGLAQRYLSDSPDLIKKWMRICGYKKIVFIGLDALTNAQEKMINFLLKEDLCNTYWDADQYFINDNKQESGKFLRRYKRKWPVEFNNITNEFLDVPKEIKILGSAKTITQAKLLGNLLMKKKYNKDNIKRVAIILPNENLLLPVLESLPSTIKNINITMGYNLCNHPILSFYYDILTLYVNKKTQTSNLKHRFQSRDILNLLENPHFKLIVDAIHDSTISEFSISLKKIGLKYIDTCDLRSLIERLKNPILELVFLKQTNHLTEIIELFKILTSDLLNLIEKKNNSSTIESECLFEIDQNLKLLSGFFEAISENVDVKTFSMFFKQLIQSKKLNFVGEPLRGIQIMGLLESRTIDFDEVFILSANEGHLPPVSRKNSFIPLDMKFHFRMRTYLDIDAIYANHFFNLIKRPGFVNILYNNDSSSSSFGSGEKSRFLQQLIYEIKILNNCNISIQEDFVSDVFKIEKRTEELIFKKDLYVLNKIQEMCLSGFSASTINLYNYCRRQFYFEKILGVKQEELNSENLDNMNMGLVTHHVLKKLYEPSLNKELTIKMLESMQIKIKESIFQSLLKYNIQEISRGKNLLAIKAIERIISNFLFQEMTDIEAGNKIIIKFLDNPEAIPPQALNMKESSCGVFIKGIIDRIDIYNNQYRIIDYKTGFVKPSEIQSVDLSDIEQKPKLLQLLLYALLFTKHQKSHNPPVSGIINLRATNFKIQYCQINKIKILDSEILQLFEDKLGDIILDICDEKQTFEHSLREESCRFCD